MILSKSHPATVLASRDIALYNVAPIEKKENVKQTSDSQSPRRTCKASQRNNDTHCLSVPKLHKARFCAIPSGRNRPPNNGRLPDDVDLEYYIIETFIQKG